MGIGKLAVLMVAGAFAFGGIGAALADWARSDPADAITLDDGRKDDAAVELAADNDDDKKKKGKGGDGDNTRGNDGTSGGNNTGDGDNTRGNDGTSGGDNTDTRSRSGANVAPPPAPVQASPPPPAPQPANTYSRDSVSGGGDT